MAHKEGSKESGKFSCGSGAMAMQEQRKIAACNCESLNRESGMPATVLLASLALLKWQDHFACLLIVAAGQLLDL